MIYMYLAEGFEETEAVATLDVLRRAGIETQTVGVTGMNVTGSHGITISCDTTPEDAARAANAEAVILPGGMPGTLNLEASDAVKDMLKYCAVNSRIIAAICAAPSILGHMGLLSGRRATCFPGFEKELNCSLYTGDQVTEDGSIITSNGAGSAFLFGEAIAARFVGREAAHKILQQMQVCCC